MGSKVGRVVASDTRNQVWIQTGAIFIQEHLFTFNFLEEENEKEAGNRPKLVKIKKKSVLI